MKKITLSLTLALGFLILVFALAGFQFLAAGPGRSEERVVFEIPHGATFVQIARQLSKQGLVRGYFRFRVFAKITGQESRIKSGEYELDRGMTPQKILSVLASGKSIMYPVTFPEGSNLLDMANILEKRGFYKASEFLAMCRNPEVIKELIGEGVTSLEGYLFPDTYNLTKFTPLKELLGTMVQKFATAYNEVAPTATVRMTRHEVVTLASVIEKETGAANERPLISSVFHNRLLKKMRLQSDPTILYGIWAETGTMKDNITKDDILRPTPYNTYTVAALPFGPIANPGKQALVAAMRPETSDYLFFVSRNDGTHVFTSNYQDHLKAVRSFQLDPEARKGRSWRDLDTGSSEAKTSTATEQTSPASVTN